jgi:hypothetical protein
VILIGDNNIPYGIISRIKGIEDIGKTEPNSTVLFDFDLELLEYCMKNDIESAVVISDILQSIYAYNFGAKFIICTQKLVIQIQDLADHYLYDSKILAIIEDASEIEKLAKKHIDGVIYSKVLGK